MAVKKESVAPVVLNDLSNGESTEVESSSGRTYTIKNVGGVYSCTCPAWKFQKNVPIERRTCKHLRSFRGDAAETARTNTPAKVGANGSATKKVRVMAAHKYRDKDIDPIGWLISEKLDGVRALWDGEEFWTRQGKLIHVPDWFKEQMPRFPLDGEFWIDRGSFSIVSGISRRQDYPEEWHDVTYMVFDSQTKETFEVRIKKAINFHDKHEPKNWKVVEQIPCKGKEHLEEVFQSLVEEGAEGIMVRDPKALYKDARVSTILKLKPIYDAEAKIIGYTAGKGKYKAEGMIGAFTLEMPNGKTFNISGMTDKLRKNPHPLDTVITYKYEGFTNTGLPRFARYQRVRSDLTWEDVLANHEKDTRAKPKVPVKPPAPKKPAKKVVKSKKPVSKATKTAKVAPKKTTTPKKPKITIEEGKTYRFECRNEKSNKFWEVRVDGSFYKISYGAIDAKPRNPDPVQFESTEIAIKEAVRKIKSKTRKGYLPANDNAKEVLA